MKKEVPDEHEQLEFSWSRHDQLEFTYDDPDEPDETQTSENKTESSDGQSTTPKKEKNGRTAWIIAGVICALALAAVSFFAGKMTGEHETGKARTESTQDADDADQNAQPPAEGGYDALAVWLAGQLADKGEVRLFEGNGEYSFDQIIVGDFDGDGMFPEAVRLHIGPNEQGEMTDGVNITFWEIDGSGALQEKTVSQAFTQLAEWETMYGGIRDDLTGGDDDLTGGDGEACVCRTFVNTFVLNQRNAYSGLDIILSGDQYFDEKRSPYSLLMHYENGIAVNLYAVKGTPQTEYRTDAASEKTLCYDHNGVYRFYAPYPEQTELTAIYEYSCESSMTGSNHYVWYEYTQLEGVEYYMKRPVLAKSSYYDDEDALTTLTGTVARFIGANGDNYLIQTDTGMMGFVQITSMEGNVGFSGVTLQNLPFREVFCEEPPENREKTTDLYEYILSGTGVEDAGIYEISGERMEFLADLDGNGLLEWVCIAATPTGAYKLMINSEDEPIALMSDPYRQYEKNMIVFARLADDPARLGVGMMSYDETTRCEMPDGSTAMYGITELYSYDEVRGAVWEEMYDIPVFDPQTGENLIEDGDYWQKGMRCSVEVWEHITPKKDQNDTEENRCEEFPVIGNIRCGFSEEITLYTDITGQTEAGTFTSDGLYLEKIVEDHVDGGFYGYLYCNETGTGGYTTRMGEYDFCDQLSLYEEVPKET